MQLSQKPWQAERGAACAWLFLLGISFAGVIAARPGQAADTAKSTGKSQEIWDVFYLQKAKIGYGRTIIRPLERGGKPLLQIESLHHLSVERFGQRTDQDLKTSTLETPDGKLLEFTTEVAFGQAPMQIHGHADGAKLIIEITSKGNVQKAQIPWSDDIRGFLGVEQSLEQKPPQPGEQRVLKMLMPLVNQVAEVDIAARDLETTSVLGVMTRLLRVETTARLPDGNAIASTIWLDASGQTIKTRVDAMQQESFRTTRAVALTPQPPGGAKFDLGVDLVIKPEKPLPNAHATRQVRYRVELAGSDPAKVFATAPTQSVRSLDAHTAEIIVRSIRAETAPQHPQEAKVGEQYTSANNVLQIEDPRIQAMARLARGSAKSPREIALALERYVHGAIEKKNFSQAFATAAEVAETREGDCTEHAVLLAALARACGIPSRVAIGLVYIDGAAGFGYHMWTELYLDGRWTPLDATLGQGGIGAAHLKLTDSSLEGTSAYSSFLPVAQVAGQLKIHILAAE